MCDLGVVVVSLIFELVRGTGSFTAVFATLTRVSTFRVGLGVSGTIVSGSCARPSYSRISHLLTSSLSLRVSSLFCRFIINLFHTTHKDKTQQVIRNRGQYCRDIELVGYLTNVSEVSH